MEKTFHHNNPNDTKMGGFETRPYVYASFALLYVQICTACANFEDFKSFGYSSRQRAKTLSLKMMFPLRLRVFAGDTPNFGCGFAALGSLRLNICVTLIAASPR